METLSSADSPTEAKKSKTPRKRKEKESTLKQKSPAEFFAKNMYIAGFDNGGFILDRAQDGNVSKLLSWFSKNETSH